MGIDIPDLSGFYRVEAPVEQLNDLAAELLDQEAVTAAYVEPHSEPPVVRHLLGEIKTAVPPVVSPDFSGQQGYLEAAPSGVDARYAWTLDGGTGATVRVIDVELGGWQFTHEDLRANQGGAVGVSGAGTSKTEDEDRSHATAVIGEIGGDSNSIGITGIAPDAHVRGVYARVQGVAAAIRVATDLLGRGDIIVVEAHQPGPTVNFTFDPVTRDTTGFIPVEWWEDVFQAIWYAVAHGVLVVEAAGNGSVNLDDPVYDTPGPGFPPGWKPVQADDQGLARHRRRRRGTGRRSLRRRQVAAGLLELRKHGRRPGLGAGVTTTGYGDLQGGRHEDEWYTGTFAGTSSATPIVAGALACVQGALGAHVFGERLTPQHARQLLRDTGTPQTSEKNLPASQRIGNLPSIGQLLPGPVIYAQVPRRVHIEGQPTGGHLSVVPPPRPSRRHGRLGRGSEDAHPGLGTLTPFSGRGGVVYAIDSTGDLFWRRHLGAGDGSNTWSPTVKIGNGWNFNTSSVPEARLRCPSVRARPVTAASRRRPADVRALGMERRHTSLERGAPAGRHQVALRPHRCRRRRRGSTPSRATESCGGTSTTAAAYAATGGACSSRSAGVGSSRPSSTAA